MHDRGAIAQWSLFIQPGNHRLPTTKKIFDECKAIKLVNRCSRKNCPGLELFDREKVFCVGMELYWSKWFFFKLSRYAITTSSRTDYCLSNREHIFRVYILSSKHERRLGEFGKVMRTRYPVKGLHNFQEISLPRVFKWENVNTGKSALYIISISLQ